VCKLGQPSMKYLVFAFPTSIWHPLRLVYYPCGVGNPNKSPAKVPEFPDMARSPAEMNGTRGARENTWFMLRPVGNHKAFFKHLCSNSGLFIQIACCIAGDAAKFRNFDGRMSAEDSIRRLDSGSLIKCISRTYPFVRSFAALLMVCCCFVSARRRPIRS